MKILRSIGVLSELRFFSVTYRYTSTMIYIIRGFSGSPKMKTRDRKTCRRCLLLLSLTARTVRAKFAASICVCVDPRMETVLSCPTCNWHPENRSKRFFVAPFRPMTYATASPLSFTTWLIWKDKAARKTKAVVTHLRMQKRCLSSTRRVLPVCMARHHVPCLSDNHPAILSCACCDCQHWHIGRRFLLLVQRQ